MSKGIVAIGAASLVSMLAGVALTLVFAAEALEAVPDEGTTELADVVAELKKNGARLDRVDRVLERELGATRRDVRQVLDARALGGGGGGAMAAGDSGSHVSRDELGGLSSKDMNALAPLANWGNDEQLRTKWLFATEKAALDTFGSPDEITVRGSAESWTYWSDVNGGRISSEYRLKFNNGRLVEGQLLKYEKPRSKPLVAR